MGEHEEVSMQSYIDVKPFFDRLDEIERRKGESVALKGRAWCVLSRCFSYCRLKRFSKSDMEEMTAPLSAALKTEDWTEVERILKYTHMADFAYSERYMILLKGALPF